jgi:SSS family solute:Na+ symporter
LSAVYLIPKVAILDTNINFSLFHKFRSFWRTVALLAGIISAIDIGFTSSQVGWSQISFCDRWRLDIQTALIVMGTIAVVYTTSEDWKPSSILDTIQWLILIGGLVFMDTYRL